MPASADILRGLHQMTNELFAAAVAWHVVVAAVVVALALRWRPSRQLAASLLVLPALSFAAAAFAFGNPFNAVSGALLAALLAVIALRMRSTSRRTARGARVAVQPAPAWAMLLGFALIGYALVYPHFVDGPWYRALIASPVGIVPCPTLALLAGFTLLAGGLGSRALPLVLAAWTAFYAFFGIVRLGVVLDAGLIVAVVGLVALTFAERTRTRSPLATTRASASLQPRWFSVRRATRG